MNKEKIAELLRQLHHELGDTEGLDQELADQLRAATQEIESVLKSEQGLASAERGVIDQLRLAAEQFEDSHPGLTNTVGRIADALSQLGI